MIDYFALTLTHGLLLLALLRLIRREDVDVEPATEDETVLAAAETPGAENPPEDGAAARRAARKRRRNA
ncbi:MAG: hypothetical protein KKE69_10990 [Alphaproteobacteria bacterium]|nr:hypothetical protein [Alphaproteobacteria bacterium]MBU1606185.1 hypothetical protein [Alphaproteobacteria bacterium]